MNLLPSKYRFIPLAALAFFGIAAFTPIIDEPGLQQTFAVAFLFGALALTYDLLLGFTGLLSFGHALFYAAGAYGAAFAMARWEWHIIPAAVFALIFATAIALFTGTAALRVKGIAFAMVTLAFAEAGHVIATLNLWGLSNGDITLQLRSASVPDFFLGVANTRNLYLLALITLVLVYVAVWWLTQSSVGRVWQALRDNEERVSVLGLRPFSFKLIAFVLAGVMAAFVGVVAVLVTNNANPTMASTQTTISLLLMVILGGIATRWGAVIGGLLYVILTQRLTTLDTQGALAGLPEWIGGPMSEPAFILGVIFILVVMFSPGGIAGAIYRLRMKFAGSIK
jgi:branched-chain amino acid transport system permease protein